MLDQALSSLIVLSDSKDTPFILLLIPLATIFLVYAYILFLSLRNFIRIRRNSQAIKFGKVFYCSLVVALAVRIVSFVLMVVGMLSYIDNQNSGKHDLNNLFTKSFLSLTYVPDIFVMLSFYIYGWLAFILFLLGLIQLPNSNLISMNSKNCYFLLWIISLGGIEIVQGAGFFLYWFNDDFFPFEPYILLNCCVNFIVALLIVAGETILHFSFAGVPYKADFHQKRFKRMNYILLFYAFGCAFKGGLNIAQKGTLPILWQAIITETTTPITSIIPPILLILQIFICEIVPILLVNDSKIIADLFVKREYNNVHQHPFSTSHQSADRSLTENLIQNNNNNNSSYSVSSDEVIVYGGQRLSAHNKDSNQAGGMEESVILDKKKVTVSQNEDPLQQEVLGLFYDALYNDDKIKARVIKVKKLTPYLTEEINREVAKFINFRNPYLLKMRGYSFEETEVTIYYEYVERGNLHEILHLRQKNIEKIDLVFKLKVAIQIAEGLKYLHTRDPKVIHGHLHPSNIWLDKDYVVKLTDYGFANLKKYASIMGKYTNITQYTAPEILAGRGKTAITDDPSADIYSFGMILWELLTEQVPFEGLDIKELQQMICAENSRPKILNNVPETLQKLIRACWQQEPQKRPRIAEVIEMLGDELEQS